MKKTEEEIWINNLDNTVNTRTSKLKQSQKDELKAEVQHYKDRLAAGVYNNPLELKQQEWTLYDDRSGVKSFQGRVVEVLGMGWCAQIYSEGVRDVSHDKDYNYKNGIDFLLTKWADVSVQCKTTHYRGDESDESEQFFLVYKNWLDCDTCKATRILAIDLNNGVGFMIDRESLKKCVDSKLGNDVWVSVKEIRQFSHPALKKWCIKSFDLNYLER